MTSLPVRDCNSSTRELYSFSKMAAILSRKKKKKHTKNETYRSRPVRRSEHRPAFDGRTRFGISLNFSLKVSNLEGERDLWGEMVLVFGVRTFMTATD